MIFFHFLTQVTPKYADALQRKMMFEITRNVALTYL